MGIIQFLDGPVVFEINVEMYGRVHEQHHIGHVDGLANLGCELGAAFYSAVWNLFYLSASVLGDRDAKKS